MSIIETNGENIITTLNKVLFMFDSRHLKSRDVHITIKLLNVKYGPETTSTLRNNKHIGIETSTTRRWFYSSLSKQLIYLLLENGMMSCCYCNIEQLEIMEQVRMRIS